MYFTRDKCDPSIKTYLKHSIISTIAFDKKQKSYTVKIRGQCGKRPGIHNTLRRKHYPKYKHSKRKQKTNKKGSSKTQGKSIDHQLNQYIAHGKKPKHRMVKCLIKYWHSIGHTLEAAQIPVYIKELDCVTQADIITSDKDGKLWMFEVKSGFPPGGSRKKGSLSGIRPLVPNTVYNHWELQRHYTTKGLKALGMPIHESRVIHVYDEHDKKQDKKVVQVKVRKIPKWILKKR